MSRPDSTALVQIQSGFVGPVLLAWIDIAGDPVRVCNAGKDLTISGHSDPELNGTYIGVSADLVSMSSVKVTQRGTEPVTAQLSGIPGLDTDTLVQISDPANWRGRDARIWRIIFNEAREQQGGIQALYTGVMKSLDVTGDSEKQTINLTIESYIAFFSRPSGRSYLDQERYDAGDLSARAGIAIANGTSTQSLNPGGGGGSPSRGGGGPANAMINRLSKQ